MGSYKRDFSKKVKRNIRKNTKIRKTNKTYKKRISYKNKRRNGNKSNKIGGLSFLRSSFSSSNSNNSRNSDIENNIENNIKEPFIVKGDKLLLVKKKITYDPKDNDPNKVSNRLNLHNKYRKSDCKKLSYPSNKECEITKKLYYYKAAYALAYDGDGYNSLKVYLPEDQNYRAYPDTAIISAEDFNIYPIKEFTKEFTEDGTFPILERTYKEKREILKKNINANLMRRKI